MRKFPPCRNCRKLKKEHYKELENFEDNSGFSWTGYAYYCKKVNWLEYTPLDNLSYIELEAKRRKLI